MDKLYHMKSPFILWLTGLSGSGKTTIAEIVYKSLIQDKHNVEWIDGDQVRDQLQNKLFSEEARKSHITWAGYSASLLEKHRVSSIVTLVSPYEETRQRVKSFCQNCYIVYINTSIEECEKRDPKGLYKKARLGEIKDFTGISAPYEVPKNPDLIVSTSGCTSRDSANEILNFLKKKNHL